MKIFLKSFFPLALLLVIALQVCAQNAIVEKKFFDAKGRETDSLSAKTYTISKFPDLYRQSIEKETYSINGQLLSKMSGVAGKQVGYYKYEGKYLAYYENGVLSEELNYVDDELSGEIKTYYPSGQLRRVDNYRAGELVNGKCYGTAGQDTTYFTFRRSPRYPGGDQGLYRFISQKIKYPKKALKKGEQGRVFVSFIVNKQGIVEKPEIEKGVNELLDQEALRVVSLLRNFEPAVYEGIPVNYRFILPVSFKLQ